MHNNDDISGFSCSSILERELATVGMSCNIVALVLMLVAMFLCIRLCRYSTKPDPESIESSREDPASAPSYDWSFPYPLPPLSRQ